MNRPKKIIIAGIDTDVGKTIVSAILVEMLEADYWKPIQTGDSFDRLTVQKLVTTKKSTFFKESYALKAALSPDRASQLENIDIQTITPPCHSRTLIIEMCGGVHVPINETDLLIDPLSKLDAIWLIVSRHYLGSINHTLLTVEALKKRNLIPAGIIFNGPKELAKEKSIMRFSKLPMLSRIHFDTINSQTILKYANLWKLHFQAYPLFGTLLPKCTLPTR